MANECEHGVVQGGWCCACAEEVNVSPEMEQAVMRTLYHHPRSSPVIVQMLTGEVFKTPPPKPTEEEKQMAHEVVEGLINLHYVTFRQACIEVTGEDPEADWV